MGPMLYLCNWQDSFQVATTLSLCLNTVVRTQFPCQYTMAAASSKGLLYHPITARCIATVAEFLMYQARADWIRQPCYGDLKSWENVALLGWIGIIGEIVCWSQLLLQSEFLNVCEDTIWAIQAAVEACYAWNNTQFVIFGLFASYLFLYHLPRIALRIDYTKPLGEGWKGVKIQRPDLDTMSWMSPMLLFLPILIALCWLDINNLGQI